ncbi:MAG: hypothetical protein RMX96_10555 [Nostoc sp. ChiSLP02]|nr:hypothetical protein [Nostoc sp. DedSLP05]MDZ8101404.1 hypothetical protein [Nostoc sp. DedSLP01]MDZ8185280.1 hypothetical protein [Nostoc sp. ChiSLP02]
MNLYHKLALLTDDEARICLNGVLKGLLALQPQYEALFASENQMQAAIEQVISELGQAPSSAIDTIKKQNTSKAIRLILIEIAENPEISPRLEAWFSSARPKLLEPVTTALVLAGIILILSTDITIEYKNQDGKKNFRVKVEKKATPSKFLEKFFSLFS